MSAAASIAARFRLRRVDSSTAVLTADGALDLASAPPFRRVLGELAGDGYMRIVIDLSQVEFMDSTALSVLVGARRRLGGSGFLAVAAARPQARQLFDLTGLRRTIPMFPTVDAAIDAGHQSDDEAGSASRRPAPLALTGDAAVVLGIASTALAFADSRFDQAERWLRALLRHGEAGIALASLGFTEGPVHPEPPSDSDPRHVPRGDEVAAVTERAHQIAAARGKTQTRSADLLVAVLDCYGADAERVLTRHGVQADDLLALLEADVADQAG